MKAYINNGLLFDHVKKADSFFSRLKGLLAVKTLNENEALLLANCTSIHCFFMKFTIDAVYLSADMEVLYKESVKPWRIGKIIKGTSNVLEMKEGLSKHLKIGDTVHFAHDKGTGLLSHDKGTHDKGTGLLS